MFCVSWLTMLDKGISWGQVKMPLTILNFWKWLYIKVLVLLLSLPNPIVWSHIVGDKATTVELKKLCEFAYTCFHDTVIICGKSVNEARTFLDLCDMYEFSCEYNIVFRHVKEEEGVCPNPKEILG